MASERELGWQAFQQGDTHGAIALLESACRQNPGDYDAHQYLGAAYGKAGRHSEAISAMTRAVQIQPSNPQARYNLGVALESGGFPVQAVAAFQQAISLEPNYFKAKEAIQRLQQAEESPRIQPESAPAAPPQTLHSHSSPSAELQPFSSSQSFTPPATQRFAAPPGNQNYLTPDDLPKPEASTTATSGFAASGESTPGYQPPCVVQRTAALPSYGLLSDYSPSPNSPSGPTSLPQAYPAVLPPPNYQDELDFIQAFKDFWQIIVAPISFFKSQAGRQGFMSPICMLGVYLCIGILISLISSGAQGFVSLAASLVFLPVNLVFILCGMMISYLITALMLHFLGWMFGNRTDYSVSFRAGVYADAPRILLGVVAAVWMAFVVLPGFRANPFTTQEIDQIFGASTNSSAPGANSPAPPASPVGVSRYPASPYRASRQTGPPTQTQMIKLGRLLFDRLSAQIAPYIILSTVGWFWTTALLMIAIHHMQKISSGAAAGVVLIMYLIAFTLVILLVMTFFTLIAAFIALIIHQSGGAAGSLGH
jgi:hypothetical protein